MKVSLTLCCCCSVIKTYPTQGDYKLFGLPSSAVGKNLHAVQEMRDRQVRPLRQEDPLEKEMATHFGTLA